MIRKEFKRYLVAYCTETGITMPSFDDRTKLFYEFTGVKYSDQTDLECELWEFLDTKLMKKDTLTLQDLAKAKHALEKANVPMHTAIVSFGCTALAPCTAVKSKWPVACNQKEEGNTPMTYNETESNRKYLNNRLSETRYAKREELVKMYRLNNSSYPKTYKELIDAIKNDQYEIDTKRAPKIDALAADGEFCGSPYDGIKFNLADAPDCDGYFVAEKQLEKQLTNAKDIINTSDATAGLKALQDFAAWVPEGNAN